MKILTMPSFGADMAVGTIVKWNVKPGDPVSRGDIIASIETMKGLIDMEVFDDGIIVTLLAAEGEELEIGRPIAELQLKNEEDSNNSSVQIVESGDAHSVDVGSNTAVNQEGASNSSDSQNDVTKESRVLTDVEVKSGDSINTRRPKISPAARNKAEQLGIDWRQLSQGTGPDGALLLDDINIADTQSAEPALDSVKGPKDMMRDAIAANVSRSKRDIPHYYLQLDMVLDNTLNWLSLHNADLPPSNRILSNAVIYSAIARTLSEFPAFNGFYRDGHYQPSDSVHLGNAISLRQGGLMVAAIHNAQNLGLLELMEKIKDQVNRARKGGLRMSEMQDATVTVSNLGDRGTDSIQSIIYPPQVAIIGIGRQRIVPWVIDNVVSSATIISMSLAADHRVSDGHSGARLLNKINKLLQTPEKLV
ncbi:dihydrolipoamide acetyltransferase family protein [Paraglaciecola sp. MB-3u-78]|uniref:dihydrolipoamide acetyltransferase family protein n=1 Tax=Paraglaciecola sp. MB-3u-78 TaxID=2058332 RepID=UPI000C31D72D|nr:dihydrolipoamide acetyltransferase family protein [Paraglaciecola sp. MB-3u-78]PKG99527.1 2-oxo acid dehydrogenase subunit E2 [Paraglaciecola sp. MB-3u-78]